jgi:3-hydroxybutyryl-CoA dehydrogenase
VSQSAESHPLGVASSAPEGGSESAGKGAIDRLAIAGSGTIASGLAACAALRGIDVVMWARSRDSARRARSAVSRACTKNGTPEALDRLRIVPELAGLGSATLVVEAVVERPDAKAEVLSGLGGVLDPDVLLASTTSSLRIQDLAGASGRADRFFGLHVFNPVGKMPLVELCYPDEATPGTRETAKAFCAALDKTPIDVPDEPGFVVNRLLFPFLFDAVRLLERTGMEPSELDACMKLGASHPMGPFELLDLIGIDVAEAIGEALYADTSDAGHRPPGRIKQLVNEGKLGRKAGAGFYTYD